MSDLLKRRKDHHVDIVLDEAVYGPPAALGFGRYTLEFDALPEVSLGEVQLGATVLGRQLSAPLVIGAMTGGTERTGEINRVLAGAAARVGLGMALGSQRAMLVDPSVAATYDVRAHAPELPLLIGNLGAVQLNCGVSAAQVQGLADRIGADALNLHLNPLQEAVQPEGDTDFRGLAAAIARLAGEVSTPLLVKEVGSGLSARTCAKLAALPIAGVEVAGTGGTSWAAVESHRAASDPRRAEVGRRLAGFGVPTPRSVQIARQAFPDRVVVASGGVSTGMDVAVALALGADVVALARPFLQAAVHGEQAVVDAMELLLFELRVICFCVGVQHVSELRSVRVIDARDGYPLRA